MEGTGGSLSVRPRAGLSGTLQAEFELRILRVKESGRDVGKSTWLGAVVGRDWDLPRNRGTMGGIALESSSSSKPTCRGMLESCAWLRFLAARCSWSKMLGPFPATGYVPRSLLACCLGDLFWGRTLNWRN